MDTFFPVLVMIMIVREIYKHCIAIHIKGRNNPYRLTWEKLRDGYWYKKVYCGVCDFGEYDVWRYNRRLGYWEIHTTKGDLDVLSSFEGREVSVEVH